MKKLKLSICSLFLILGTGCMKSPTQPIATVAPTVSKYLYIATGQCYSGTGNTTFTTATASNLVYRMNASTGAKDITLADYSAFPATVGDSPAGVAEFDADNLLILVENSTSGRRIEKMAKVGAGSRAIFNSNTTILSAVLRGITKLSDGSFLVNKSSGFEKLTSTGSRIGLPLIGSNLGATCGAAITQMTATQSLANGKIVFLHAAAANNRFGLLSASGYLTAADCLAATAAPNVASFPVASVYIAAVNQLIVAYAGNAITTNINSIYVYDVNESTNAITNPTKIYDAALYPSSYGYLLYGISAMAYDAAESTLFISTATSSATTVSNYVIEKFTYDTAAKLLTRVGTQPFYNYGVDTKCISSMFVGN